MAQRTVHVIGAGLAGLSASTALAERGWFVQLYEAAPQAGGRCRSYVDKTIGATIDNGNHVILSGNHSALAYLDRIGARDSLIEPDRPAFDFVDLRSDERWHIELNEGRIPWWIFNEAKRVPGTRPFDYLKLLGLRFSNDRTRISDILGCHGTLYERLWEPLLLAALNTEPPLASARLANAVIRQTLGRGGKACRLLVTRDGLSAAFIDPAIRLLEQRGAAIHFGCRLRSISLKTDRADRLLFGDHSVQVTHDDQVVLAVSGTALSQLLPEVDTPVEHRAIINGHFKIEPPSDLPPILGVIGGDVEWIFSYRDRISTTTSSADRLIDMPRDVLAQRLWSDIERALGFSQTMPPWQVVKERRATFATLPSEEIRRPTSRTRWANLVLAGDYTATGLPATIEGAIRSGVTAANLLQHSAGRRTRDWRPHRRKAGKA
ncbi:hydroxysqualene dehydroxylase HpnE [Microvirga terricola]|uniref:NAD(P)-binding protein n=1 Tax=Microvirga terricola TaxID=2719797 RepID=A0ABX0VI92_9HYPH|nr:hydroxysqualene dehydroxylase HpnE [Microvirga terricola]NIX78237.1 NAD(P)-binding protein [Microvirga terricola]